MDSTSFSLSLLAVGYVLWSLVIEHDEPMRMQSTVDPDVPINQDGLYPLRHPMWCARQAAKQAVLLEDHLTDVHKMCHECIRKHFLMFEGFLDEAIVMDKHMKYNDLLIPVRERLKPILISYRDGVDTLVVAQQIRELRKAIATPSFDYFE